MDDSFLVMLGLLATIALLLGPIGFFLTLRARSRLKRVEARIALLLAHERQLEAVLMDSPAAPDLADKALAAPAADEAIATRLITPAVPDETAIREETLEIASEAALNTPDPDSPATPPKRKVGIEEKLGAHWAVLVGGVALAFGALLLVKYSIDQGFFGPGLRVVCGLVLGAALVAAGEYLRREEPPGEGSAQPAPIPPVLTGAGTV